MKKLLLSGFVILGVLKFCASCSDSNNSEYDGGSESHNADTSRPPLTDTLGTDIDTSNQKP